MKNIKVALAFVLALGSASLAGCSSVPENVSVEEETTVTSEESEEQGYDEIDAPDPDVYSSIPFIIDILMKENMFFQNFI